MQIWIKQIQQCIVNYPENHGAAGSIIEKFYVSITHLIDKEDYWEYAQDWGVWEIDRNLNSDEELFKEILITAVTPTRIKQLIWSF